MQKISIGDYEKFLEDLAKSKKVELEEIKKKMIECGAPGFTGASVSYLTIVETILLNRLTSNIDKEYTFPIV